ncbi:MAG: PIN domain-containing protein [Chloroflexota bacterium]
MNFSDTSAFFAILDRDDPNHEISLKIWARLVTNDETILTTNYVILESYTLLQRRLGMDIVKNFHEHIIPFLQIIWVDQALHNAGVEALLRENRRRLSLVDCVSFEVCRQQGIESVFAFDQHFTEQGFTTLSS